ncbi:MAG: hypothetical protein C5B55_08450 [Blastocatellia bacterium]|nr:MAG: hypothetical protein C5B55_08450 [Blastocatellia bacterium]
MKRLFVITCAVAMVMMSSLTSFAKEITVRGRLQPTVESGGWLIVSGSDKYLILNARKYQNESWFKESTQVEAVGETKPDVVTTQMEGTPFEVRTMRPIEQPATTGNDTPGTTKVTVAGDAVVQAQPDTAIVTVSVVTQNKQAIAAQQENAAKSDAVVRAVKAAAGAGAEVKTSGYSLQPQRIYKEGQPPTISGYEARNSVTVTMGDLNRVGAVIDAAATAGANDVTGVSFTLRQDKSARARALAEATREAMDKAKVIAQALGGRVVRILEVQEGGVQRPAPVNQTESYAMRSAAASTPIEVGSMEINSRVQLIAEVEGNL